MQFTGLLDKNGKEIFEGDVVKKESPSYWKNAEDEPDDADIEMWSGGTGKVISVPFGFYIDEIKCGTWCFNGPEGREWSNSELEVIGNIYEHPHLLSRNTEGVDDQDADADDAPLQDAEISLS